MWRFAMKKTAAVRVGMTLAVSGCAEAPDDISGHYVSPLQFHDYSCDQLGQELARINTRTVELIGHQQGEATKDAVALGAGILFWPALFFMVGGSRAEELARMKGEIAAIEQAAIQRNCKDVSAMIGESRDAAENQAGQ